MNKKVLLLTAALCAIVHSGFTLDFSLRPGGFVFIPAGAGNEAESGDSRYEVGGGGSLGFELDFASIWPNPLGLGYSFGAEGGLLATTVKDGESQSMQMYSLGGGFGVFYFPLSRLLTRVDGALGVYQATSDAGKNPAALWWRVGIESGFRITPMFTVAANGGWRQYQSGGKSGVFNSGVYLGLTVQITFEAGSRSASEGTAVSFRQDGFAYPAFFSLYQNNPAGVLTIRNNENAEIRDMRVSFRAGDYTASEYPCGSVSIIPKGRGVPVPLYADFSPEILRFTDSGSILGEVVVRYRFLGQERMSVRSVTLSVHNRNTLAGMDDAELAAFVSPSSPDMLEYSKYIVGVARTNRRESMNQNMQFGIWLFEGLRLAGVKLDERGGGGEAQFPAETLGFMSGSSRDLGLLYSGALESAGIAAALIPLEDDFIVAVSTGVGEAAAEILFYGSDRIVAADGVVWIPLSMNSLAAGFMTAWANGVQALNAAAESDADISFIALENAWETYPPSPLPVQGGRPIRLDESALAKAAADVLNRYSEQELQPLLRDLQSRIATAPTATLVNRQGIVLTRMGRTAEAKAAFERAMVMGSLPATINRANLALNEQDYAAAERLFRQALSQESENSAALRGLERVEERK